MGIDPALKKFLKYRYSSAWIKNTKQEKSKKNQSNSKKKLDQKDKDQFTIDPNLIKSKNNDSKYPEYYSKSGVNIFGRKEAYYPNDVHVTLFDCTSKMKDYPEYIVKNGNDYIFKYVLYEAITFLGMDGCSEAFFMCFDRGSPANKDNEHSNRYKNLNFSDLDKIGDDKIYISDNYIIDKKEWPLFANDKKLKQELIHYITTKIIDVQDLSLSNSSSTVNSRASLKHYVPPENKILFLFGGILEKPTFPRRDRKSRRPDAELYYVTNEKQTHLSNDDDDVIYGQTSNYKRISGIYKPIDECYKLDEQLELLEGELSCIYFSKPYIKSGKNILFITGDGDLLLQLLLTSKDRLNESGGFKNKIYLRLLVHDGFEDVDINSLFILMCEDPLFKNNGISDPPIYITLASCLIKNDYYSNFCNGIGNLNVSGCECPIILYSLLSMLCEFKDILSILPARRTNFEEVSIFINEDLFIKFVYSIYVIKYKSLALKKIEKNTPKSEKFNFKNSLSILDELQLMIPNSCKINTFSSHRITKKDIKMVNDYLNGLNSIKNRILSKDRMRVYCRMTEWILIYYYNSYRGKCKIISPLSTFDQESYYGWTISISDNKCICSEKVSKKRISDVYHLCNRDHMISMNVPINLGPENIISKVTIQKSDSMDYEEDNSVGNYTDSPQARKKLNDFKIKDESISYGFLPNKSNVKLEKNGSKNVAEHVSYVCFTEDFM
jgi:hypothetical protein